MDVVIIIGCEGLFAEDQFGVDEAASWERLKEAVSEAVKDSYPEFASLTVKIDGFGGDVFSISGATLSEPDMNFLSDLIGNVVVGKAWIVHE